MTNSKQTETLAQSQQPIEQMRIIHDEHAAMALEYLKGYQPEIYRRLMRVQKEGWEMFNTLCARMVALADEAPG